MRLNQAIEEELSRWRPTLGNEEDIAIWSRVNSPIGKYRSLEKEQKYLLELLRKRIKEGAIKPSMK